jgi:hypothetical protein
VNNNPFRLLASIAFEIGIPLVFLSLFGGLYSITQRDRAGLLLFLGAVVPVALLMAISPFIFTQDRYVFMSLPCWIILGAVAIRELFSYLGKHRSLLAAGVLIILIGDAAIHDLQYYYVNNGNRLDWRGAFSLVQERSREGDRLVAWWTEFSPYYSDRKILSWEEARPDSVTQDDNRTWFVTDSETVWNNPELKTWVESNAELIDVRSLRIPWNKYLRIYLYDPARAEKPNNIES